MAPSASNSPFSSNGTRESQLEVAGNGVRKLTV